MVPACALPEMTLTLGLEFKYFIWPSILPSRERNRKEGCPYRRISEQVTAGGPLGEGADHISEPEPWERGAGHWLRTSLWGVSSSNLLLTGKHSRAENLRGGREKRPLLSSLSKLWGIPRLRDVFFTRITASPAYSEPCC